MASLPRITVATICWNAAGTIRDTLESLQAQNYPNLEYLVIDGGSKDDTLNIVRSYTKLNATIDSGPDEGPNHAYQKAILQAKGELFGLLNADDILEPGALHAVAAAWQAQQTDVITLPAKVVTIQADGSQTVINSFTPKQLEPRLANIARGRIFPNARFCKPAFLRSLPIRYKLPDGRKCNTADLDFFLRLTRQPFTNTTLSGPSYIYRQHEGSITFNTNPHKQKALAAETLFIHRRFICEHARSFTVKEWFTMAEAQLRLLRIYALRTLKAARA